MKKILMALFLLISMKCFALVEAEGLLPSLVDTVGKAMPSLGEALQRYPDAEISDADGFTEVFQNVSETDFNTFSVYLAKKGAKLADYQTTDVNFSSLIQVEANTFTFNYNIATLEARVVYPVGTYDEWLEYVKASREKKIAPFRSIGEYVVFGKYEQDANTANGPEPIEWQVLDYDNKNNCALLFSKYGLDFMPYNPYEKDKSITWETCTLRTWLNSEFLNNAFSASEQECILTTTVDNGKNQGFEDLEPDGGNNTQDKIFLLSYAEATKYFGVLDENNLKCRILPTEFAVQKGATILNDDGIGPSGFWHLRSHGELKADNLIAGYRGFLKWHSCYVESCVCPAFWINLESDIFQNEYNEDF